MSDNPDFDRAVSQWLEGKLVVAVAVPAPNRLDVTTNDGMLLHIVAATESMVGAPYLKVTQEQVGPAHDGQAQHMLGNIGMLWFSDPNTENRPHAELLAAARADISTLLRYAIPAAYNEDVAVQAAQQAAALWREAHDALQSTRNVPGMDDDDYVHGEAEENLARYAAARAALEAHGLVRPPVVAQVLEGGAAESLVTPPAPEAYDYSKLPWVECVHSSNVQAYALPVQGATVHLRFIDGSVYEYSNVPGVVREQLAGVNNAGGSVGAFVHTNLAPYAVGRVA